MPLSMRAADFFRRAEAAQRKDCMNFQDIIAKARGLASELFGYGTVISSLAVHKAADTLLQAADGVQSLVDERDVLMRENGKLREHLNYETRDCVARGQTIIALRRELAEADVKANEATEKLTTLEAAYNSLRTLWEQQRRTIAKYQECGVRTAVIIDYESDYVGRPGKRRWTLNDRGEPVQVNGGANTIDSSHTHKPVHGGRPDTQATRAEGGEPSETAGMHVPAVPLTLREIGRPIGLEASSGEYSEGHMITDDGQVIPFCRFSIKVGGTD